jgi:hypothetical protein
MLRITEAHEKEKLLLHDVQVRLVVYFAGAVFV